MQVLIVRRAKDGPPVSLHIADSRPLTEDGDAIKDADALATALIESLPRATLDLLSAALRAATSGPVGDPNDYYTRRANPQPDNERRRFRRCESR